MYSEDPTLLKCDTLDVRTTNPWEVVIAEYITIHSEEGFFLFHTSL